MLPKINRTVEWNRFKRKKKNTLTANDPQNPGPEPAPSLTPPDSQSMLRCLALGYAADRPPSARVVGTSQGNVPSPSHSTLMAPTEHPPTTDLAHSQSPTPSIMINLPSDSASPTTIKHGSNKGHDSSKNQTKLTSGKHALITRSLKVVLTILGELAGAPTVTCFAESLDNDERDCSTRKGLDEYCDGLLKTIESVMAKEVSDTPNALRDGLQRLHSKLTIAQKEIRGHSILVDVEGIARRITDQLQVFLFESYLGGLITRPDLNERMERHILSQAIRDLPRAKAAYNDYTKDKQRISCFEGTRQALLQEIVKWLSAWDDSRAYLLFGIAGIGKSTVAQTIAERADNLGCLGASFFFSRNEADCRTAEKLFTTIAFQLCVYDEEFARAIGRALTEERGAAAKIKEPQEQLRALIVEPLRNVVKSKPFPIAIVVDALDECDTQDAPTVLMALDQLVRELPFFKVILTICPHPHLRYLLDHLGDHRIFHLRDIEETVVDGDIRLYLKHSLSLDRVHTHLHQKWAPSDEDIEALVRAAGQLFIIASTTVLFILDTVACNPASRMKNLRDEFSRNRTPFGTLNNFYTVILRSAVPLGCAPDIVELYQSVVGTIVLIESPLPVRALANLTGMSEDDVRSALGNLQSVISLGNNDVPLVYHKSFPDHITDDQRCQDRDLHIAPRDHHTRLATRCLYIMNAHLKYNILGLGAVSQYLDNEKALEEERLSWNSVQQVIPSTLQYASVHWAKHAAHADFKDTGLMVELKTFTEEHLLHWLEALSWIRKLDTAHILLGIVLGLQTLNCEMRQIFSDTLRFVSRSYEKIEQAALHLYHSALPFMPTDTLLHKKYKHEIHLCQVEGGSAQWDIIVVEEKHGGNIVHHLAFAKDNSQFISWDKDNVKLWDGASGMPIKTFDGSEIALADDFSVLAVPQGSSVTMYCVSSSAPIASFNHPSTVVRTAISFDGSWLAAGLRSGTVRVWDIAKGISTASLDDYDRGPLAFSPHGHMLAFTSTSGIDLWNGVDVVARLEHELEDPVKIAFSSDGTRLATLAEEDDVYGLRLWNGADGDFIAGVPDVAEELVISVNGSFIATGGLQKEVQVWSGDSLALIDTIPITDVFDLAFSGDILAIADWLSVAVTLYDIKRKASIATLKIDNPSSVAFSPDGTRLAAGNVFGTVHLWDVPATRATASASKQQWGAVSALALSQDCSRLASGHRDGSLALWDAGNMRQEIAYHKHHSQWVQALAWSPDNKQLASGSADKTVKFCDSRDGSQIGILEYSFPGRLTSLAFSNSLLAAGTAYTVTLWDHTSLCLIHTIEQGASRLSFSLGSSILVSILASNFEKDVSEIIVWDAKKFTVAATFAVSGNIIALLPSPDGSMLATQVLNSGFNLFDIANREVISDPENKDLSWVPHLNGIPLSWSWNVDDGYHLVGRVSTRHSCVPMLWFPRDCDVRAFTSHSSTFALGCRDGSILVIRPLTI